MSSPETRQAMTELLGREGRPVVSFSLNRPRDCPVTDAVRLCFDEGAAELERFGLPWQERLHLSDDLRLLASLPPDTDPLALKRLLMHVERRHPLGRLFDLDCTDGAGRPVDGAALGRETRPCFLCGGEALRCRREARHPREEAVAWFLARAEDWARRRRSGQELARRVGRSAAFALSFEIALSPKPGLVDALSSNAHDDMDCALMLRSAAVLPPFFARCARLAVARVLRGLDDPRALFRRLRPLGMEAERRMYASTGGVNAHKGLIFSLGLLAAAAGSRVARDETLDAEGICAEAARMVAGIVDAELRPLAGDVPPATTGERNYLRHGSAGIRGEAAAAFPALRTIALPALATGGTLAEGAMAALLALSAELDDSNVLGRGGAQGAERFRAAARRAAEAGWPATDGGQAFESLCVLCRQERLSPGGAADLVACALFLHDLLGEAPTEKA